MRFQHPVFVPGPADMPREVRKACYAPKIDHRVTVFGEILNPCPKNIFAPILRLGKWTLPVHKRIKSHVRRTPVRRLHDLNEPAGATTNKRSLGI